MIKQILYASDLGLYGPYLMRQMAVLAQNSDIKVDILHVVEPMGLFAESVIDSYMSDQDRQYLRTQGVQEVVEGIRLQVVDSLKADYAKTLAQVSVSNILVEVGKPADVILEQANLRSSDLIVMGSHGQQGYQEGILGSVTNKVLQMSAIPVYVIPMLALNDIDRC